MKRIVFIIVVFLLSCSVEPRKINYGEDGCHYCKMSIVDPQHAAQVVTEKGKIFNYDAIECMMNHLANWDQAAPALYRVNVFDRPKKLADATSVHYLISPDLPSPMGAFLTAFENQGKRDSYVQTEDDIPMTWEQLKLRFEVQ